MPIKVAIVCFLVVFSLQLNAQTTPHIIIEQQNAVAVSFPLEGNLNSWNIYKNNSPQPLAGKKEFKNGKLIFRPVISFQSGLTYVIKQSGTIKYTFSPPITDQPKPKAIRIYPTPDSLPVNLLKFYVAFSEPMAEGNPYDSLHLIDSENDTLNDVFLKQLPALWNRDRTILSLWLDPGRIKRDLNLNKRLGNPLQESQDYRLVVDTTLKSSRGIPLQSTFQKKFSTIAADRKEPRPETWDLNIPQKGTTWPLVIHFNEAMDYGATDERLTVFINNKPVKGEAVFKNRETEWVFNPDQPWQKGIYTIRADARVEDLAGNNLNRLFDRDINKENRAEKNVYTISFEVQ